MAIDIDITIDGANALRDFAHSMPIAMDNIVNHTETLINVYQSVADEIGPHNAYFYEMLMLIKKAQEEAKEAIEVLPRKLEEIADKIEAFVASKPQ